MEGITNPAFRALIARRRGIGVVCTEFVRVSSSGVGTEYFTRQVVRAEGAALSVQVMGNHLDHMAKATEIVARAGADIVDLNVGCPAPRVVRKGVGSAMLRDRDLLSRVVESMRRNTRGFLSAKMRAGFDDATGAVGIARLLEASGCDLITVHPRRRTDFFGGVADWRIIAAIKSALSIPVVGNGDVWYAADALRMRSETSCDGVMIGRGALRNPWIFEQIDALLRGEAPLRPHGNDLLDHLDVLSDTFERERRKNPLGMLKEQVRYLVRSLPDGSEVGKRALRSASIDELRAVLKERLAGERADALDLAATGGTLERRPSPEGASNQEAPQTHGGRPRDGRAGEAELASNAVCSV